MTYYRILLRYQSFCSEICIDHNRGFAGYFIRNLPASDNAVCDKDSDWGLVPGQVIKGGGCPMLMLTLVLAVCGVSVWPSVGHAQSAYS